MLQATIHLCSYYWSINSTVPTRNIPSNHLTTPCSFDENFVLYKECIRTSLVYLYHAKSDLDIIGSKNLVDIQYVNLCTVI